MLSSKLGINEFFRKLTVMRAVDFTGRMSTRCCLAVAGNGSRERSQQPRLLLSTHPHGPPSCRFCFIGCPAPQLVLPGTGTHSLRLSREPVQRNHRRRVCLPPTWDQHEARSCRPATTTPTSDGNCFLSAGDRLFFGFLCLILSDPFNNPTV